MIDQLSSKPGATIERLQKLTDWQSHTVRAMLSTLRKNGFTIETEKRADKPTVYRIAAAAGESAEQPQASSTETAAS